MVYPFEGKKCVVVSSPSYRDHITVGTVYIIEGMVVVENAFNVIRYGNNESFQGVAEKESNIIRRNNSSVTEYIPLISVSKIIICKW